MQDKSESEKTSSLSTPPTRPSIPGEVERPGNVTSNLHSPEELAQTRAQLIEAQRRNSAQAEELAKLRLKLRFTEVDRGLVRKDLATIYNARYWRVLQRYWSIKRAWSGLLKGSLRGVKDLAKTLLPLSAQQWLVRAKRRYGKGTDTLATALGPMMRTDWDDEPLSTAHFDVVCFSIVEWDFRFQRPQQLMAQMAHAGHRVFYISQHFRGGGKPFQITNRGENLYEVSLRGPAVNVYTGTLTAEQRAELQASLNALRRELGLGATLSVVQLPFWWPLAEAMRQECAWPVLYDCMDFHAGFFSGLPQIQETETSLLAGADHVVVSSQYLLAEMSRHTSRVSLIRNGCDYEHFAQIKHDARATGRRPQIGYYGTMAEWFDADLVADLAQQRPDWDFVLIGSTATADLKRLSRLSNVRLRGEQPYARLPHWLQQMDVLLIPFKRLPLTEAANPAKVYEILAAGKPLVAVPLPEIVALNDREPLVQFARNAEEFIREIETALAQHLVPDLAPDLVAQRRAFARAHTWRARGEELMPLAQACFPKASIVIVTYHNRELNRECLQALYERTEWPNFEVFVVDNASTDGTPEMLRGVEGKYPGLTVTLNERNVGFAKANNQALREATGDYLVLLNNDTVVTRGWLAGLIRHLAADEYLGLVGPVTNEIGNDAKIPVGYYQLADMPRWAQRYVLEHDDELVDLPMLAMFCVAIRRAVFSAIGELDERFGIGMFEDDDYSYRIRHAGLKTQCAQDVFIHHHGQASFKMMTEEQYRELFEENRRRYEEKWGEPWVPHGARR